MTQYLSNGTQKVVFVFFPSEKMGTKTFARLVASRGARHGVQ